MLITLFKAALLASFGIFIVPKKWKYPLGLVLAIFLVASSGTWAVDA